MAAAPNQTEQRDGQRPHVGEHRWRLEVAVGAELAETHEDLNHHLEPLMIQILIRSIGGALEQGAQTAEGLLVGGGGGGGVWRSHMGGGRKPRV